MRLRAWGLLAGVVIGFALVAGAVSRSARAAGDGDVPERSAPVKANGLSGGPRGATLADIGPAPEIALTDQEGRPFRLSTLRGKAVLVGFVYTTCNGVCPATTHAMYRVQQSLREAGLWGKQVEFVSVSLDPARDTPEVLANYARIYDADLDSWHFLTGEPDRVAKVIDAWGMWARIGPSGTIDHPSRIFLIDPNGRQREIYNLEFLKPETVVRDVQRVLGGVSAEGPESARSRGAEPTRGTRRGE